MAHYSDSVMSGDFSSLLSSEIFQLTADGGARRFLVHSDILTRQSAPLRALVSGNWRESTERKISLEDWDGDTVGRFISFLYTGDYEYPDPLPLLSTSTPDSQQEGSSGVLACSEEQQPVTMGRGSVAYWEACLEEWDIEWPEEEEGAYRPLEECIPPEFRRKKKKKHEDNEEKRLLRFDLGSHDYSNLFMTHVKVYALAQYKDVLELRKLSLERLMFALKRVGSLERSGSSQHLEGNVVELLGWVYECTDELDNSKDPMRVMVMEFVANNYGVLKENEEMKGLMKGRAHLAADLLGRVMSRIEVYEDELDDDWLRV